MTNSACLPPDETEVRAAILTLDAIAQRRFGPGAGRFSPRDVRRAVQVAGLYGAGMVLVVVPNPLEHFAWAQFTLAALALVGATKTVMNLVHSLASAPDLRSPRTVLMDDLLAHTPQDLADIRALRAYSRPALTHVQRRLTQRTARLQEGFETWLSVPGKNGAFVTILVASASFIPIALRTLAGAPAWAPLLVMGVAAFTAAATVHAARFNTALVQLRALGDLLDLAVDRAPPPHSQETS